MKHRKVRIEREAPAKAIEMFKLYRDMDGFVHTPNGHMPKSAYEAIRLLNPDLKFPAHADLPPLNA